MYVLYRYTQQQDKGNGRGCNFGLLKILLWKIFLTSKKYRSKAVGWSHVYLASGYKILIYTTVDMVPLHFMPRDKEHDASKERNILF